jgi:hypothetical protein
VKNKQSLTCPMQYQPVDLKQEQNICQSVCGLALPIEKAFFQPKTGIWSF